MRILSGAIVVLAGAVVFGAAILGQEVCRAAKTYADAAPAWGFVVGLVLALVGFLIMAARTYPRDDYRPPDRPA